VALFVLAPVGATWPRPRSRATALMASVAAMIAGFGHAAIATEADALIYEAVRLSDEERYDRAEQVAKKAFELAIAERPTVTYKVAVSHRLLYNIYVATDRQTDSVKIAEDCVAFIKRASEYDRLREYVLQWKGRAFTGENSRQPRIGDWHPLPGALRMLSDAYVGVDRGEEAELHARESLELARCLCGTVSSDAAESYISLADAYESQGRHAIAIPALEQAASIYEDLGEYFEAADVEQEMAGLLKKCGEDERAAKFEYRAKLVKRVGEIKQWINAFPFGSRGLIAVVLGTTVAAIWLYRRRRSRGKKS
jgi:tetratricopeptide (TPR) repeat protein